MTLDQSFSNEILEKLVSGVHTPEGRASAQSIKRVSSRRVKVVLVTGMKRQIRLMFDAVHLKVTKLVRIRIGLLTGGGLEMGKCIALDDEDIQNLQTNPKGGRPDSGHSPDPSPRPAQKSARRPIKKSGPQLSFKMPAKKKSEKKRR